MQNAIWAFSHIIKLTINNYSHIYKNIYFSKIVVSSTGARSDIPACIRTRDTLLLDIHLCIIEEKKLLVIWCPFTSRGSAILLLRYRETSHSNNKKVDLPTWL